MLSIKGIVLVIHVTLVKPNVIQMLDGMNMIIHVKVQTHQNAFEATSTTILHGLSLKMLEKMLRPGRTYLEATLWKPDLNEQKGFERLVLFRHGVT